MNHNLSIAVQEFTYVKDLQLYYLWPNFKGKISHVQENVKTVSCSCGSTTKKALVSQQKYPCIVDFDKDGDIVWAILFCNVLKDVFPADNPTKSKIQTFLLEMKNFQTKLDTKKTPMNITNLTLKDLC